jgi:glycerophosphoryl diester phosphodiesterase
MHDGERARGGFSAVSGPLLFAHRGASAEHVENTLPAFEAALRLGADVIESDVHLTRDGHPVLAHDADGARVAGDPRAIAECTLAEAQRWNLAGPSSPAVSAHMPALDEALAALPNACFNLDLKATDPRLAERVLEIVARHGAEPRVLLTSFDSVVTRNLRRLDYRGSVGLCQAEAVWAVFAPALLLRARRAVFGRSGVRLQIPVRSWGIPLARGALIAKLRELSLPVDYWVINDPAQAERLLELGAAGIVTDDVRGMASVFARSSMTAAWRARHPELL